MLTARRSATRASGGAACILHKFRAAVLMRKICLYCAFLALLGSAAVRAATQSNITGLTVTPAAADVGDTVSATATGSAGYCGAVHIDWGDGTAVTYATERLPYTQTHVYKNAGTFDLRAQGMGNCTGEARARIVIKAPPPPPPPPATPAPPPPAPRLTGVTLSAPRVEPRNAVAIALEGSGTCRVTLDFGDGNSQDIAGPLPTTVRHTYNLPGRYSIVATPASPCSERRAATLEVGARVQPRITGLDVAVPPGAESSVRSLTVLGSGRCSYTLDFGDGNTETREGTLPDGYSHNYPAEGRYTAVVTAHPPCSGEQRSTFIVARRNENPDLKSSISRVDVRPQVARLGDPITLTIAGSGICKFVVDFDDGQSRTVTERLPHELTYRYARAGSYDIVVWAHEPCTGGGDVLLRIRARALRLR